jgi:four helix bundle protein
MQEQGKALEQRTKEFAISILRFVRSLPCSAAEQVPGKQLARAGSAVGANYRAARRSRSSREFVARLAVVVEESDESVYWLDLLADGPARRSREFERLWQEARELRAIFSASLRTARARLAKRQDAAHGSAHLASSRS